MLSVIGAAVLRKTAIQFTRFVSLYHAIAGSSHCCVDQPIVLMVTTMLSAIKLALSLVKSHPSAPPFSRPRMTPLTEPRPAARSPT